MSILLDSLRKSEAQRNVGDTPTIYSTQDFGGAGDSNKRWVTWLLLAVAAFAIIWFGWKQYSFPGDEVTQVAAPVEQTSAPAEADAGRPVQEPAQALRAEPVRRTPVEQLAQESAPTDASANTDEVDSSPLDRVAAFEADEAPVLPVDSEEQVGDEDGMLSEDLASLEEDVVDDDLPIQQETPDRPFRSRLSQTDPPEEDVLSYWQLPQGLRNELPEFKITVLVYAEVPEDRFVLMNGERLQELDEFEGDVTLEEIRRDGAVFSYQTYRFLVKN